MIPIALMAFGAKWWKLGAGAVLGAALALPLGQCQGRVQERTRNAAAVAEANARAQAANSALLEKASQERAADTAKITEAAKGRTDAIRAGPDAPPAAPHCRADRERLLNAGFSEADVAKHARPDCR